MDFLREDEKKLKKRLKKFNLRLIRFTQRTWYGEVISADGICESGNVFRDRDMREPVYPPLKDHENGKVIKTYGDIALSPHLAGFGMSWGGGSMDTESHFPKFHYVPFKSNDLEVRYHLMEGKERVRKTDITRNIHLSLDEATIPVLSPRISTDLDLPRLSYCRYMLSTLVVLTVLMEKTHSTVPESGHLSDLTEVLWKREKGSWAMFYCEVFRCFNMVFDSADSLFPSVFGFVRDSNGRLDDIGCPDTLFTNMRHSILKMLFLILENTPSIIRPVGQQHAFLLCMMKIGDVVREFGHAFQSQYRFMREKVTECVYKEKFFQSPELFDCLAAWNKVNMCVGIIIHTYKESMVATSMTMDVMILERCKKLSGKLQSDNFDKSKYVDKAWADMLVYSEKAINGFINSSSCLHVSDTSKVVFTLNAHCKLGEPMKYFSNEDVRCLAVLMGWSCELPCEDFLPPLFKYKKRRPEDASEEEVSREYLRWVRRFGDEFGPCMKQVMVRQLFDTHEKQLHPMKSMKFEDIRSDQDLMCAFSERLYVSGNFQLGSGVVFGENGLRYMNDRKVKRPVQCLPSWREPEGISRSTFRVSKRAMDYTDQIEAAHVICYWARRCLLRRRCLRAQTFRKGVIESLLCTVTETKKKKKKKKKKVKKVKKEPVAPVVKRRKKCKIGDRIKEKLQKWLLLVRFRCLLRSLVSFPASGLKKHRAKVCVKDLQDILRWKLSKRNVIEELDAVLVRKASRQKIDKNLGVILSSKVSKRKVVEELDGVSRMQDYRKLYFHNNVMFELVAKRYFSRIVLKEMKAKWRTRMRQLKRRRKRAKIPVIEHVDINGYPLQNISGQVHILQRPVVPPGVTMHPLEPMVAQLEYFIVYNLHFDPYLQSCVTSNGVIPFYVLAGFPSIASIAYSLGVDVGKCIVDAAYMSKLLIVWNTGLSARPIQLSN